MRLKGLLIPSVSAQRTTKVNIAVSKSQTGTLLAQTSGQLYNSQREEITTIKHCNSPQILCLIQTRRIILIIRSVKEDQKFKFQR